MGPYARAIACLAAFPPAHRLVELPHVVSEGCEPPFERRLLQSSQGEALEAPVALDIAEDRLDVGRPPASKDDPRTSTRRPARRRPSSSAASGPS